MALQREIPGLENTAFNPKEMFIQQFVSCFCQNGHSNSFGNCGRLKIVTVCGFPFTSFSLLGSLLVLIVGG